MKKKLLALMCLVLIMSAICSTSLHHVIQFNDSEKGDWETSKLSLVLSEYSSLLDHLFFTAYANGPVPEPKDGPVPEPK